MRILIFEVHPMKLGATLMNAFLFNCGIILVLMAIPILIPYGSCTYEYEGLKREGLLW